MGKLMGKRKDERRRLKRELGKKIREAITLSRSGFALKTTRSLQMWAKRPTAKLGRHYVLYYASLSPRGQILIHYNRLGGSIRTRHLNFLRLWSVRRLTRSVDWQPEQRMSALEQLAAQACETSR